MVQRRRSRARTHKSRSSGALLSASPPAEKATARQEEQHAWQSNSNGRDRYGHGRQKTPNLTTWERGGVNVKVCFSGQEGRNQHSFGRCGRAAQGQIAGQIVCGRIQQIKSFVV